MRLIDADALLEQIDIDSKGREGQYGDEWEFIDTIKSAPTIKALYPCNKKRCAHCHIECNLTSDREFALTKADMVVIADACKLETIEPECGEWIPCSERLPSEGDEFLITWTSSVTNGPLLAFAEYEPDALLVSGGKWYLEDDMGEFEDFDVIAWMPLPEPWKGADYDTTT